MSGNSYYSGTECQHPGDSTPWPDPLLAVMVAINAAEFLEWGYTANRAINHYEWTNRKIDMSAGGGVNSGGWAGQELRRRVSACMTGSGDDMTPDEARAIIRDELGQFFARDTPIVTNDRASTPNNIPYSYETALERIIRLVSGTYVGETGKPHN